MSAENGVYAPSDKVIELLKAMVDVTDEADWDALNRLGHDIIAIVEALAEEVAALKEHHAGNE